MEVMRVPALIIALAMPMVAFVQMKFPERPKDSFISDQAQVLNPAETKSVERGTKSFQAQADAPLFVVIIPSLASMDARNQTVETYGRLLFEKWKLGTAAKNRAVLFLISKDEKKAAFELGTEWQRTRQNWCLRVMQTTVAPHLELGQFGAGTVSGVDSLDSMTKVVEGSPVAPTMMLHAGVAVPMMPLPPSKPEPAKGIDPIWIASGAVFLVVMVVAIVASARARRSNDVGWGS
jgi:uncharacterized membrane protein YgcG